MADFKRIDQNLKYLAENNAPAEDVQKYIAHEGVSVDDILDATGTAVDTVKRFASDTWDSMVEAYEGKHDPKFKDVPGFWGEGLDSPEIRSRLAAGKAVTFGDEAYSDVVREALGDRLVSSEKDKHGYEVLTYKGDDGKERKAYLNKPGLDWEDVDRGLSSALPFLAGGAAVGIPRAAGAAMGVGARMALQGAGAATASVAADQAAEEMGSEQGTDLWRAGMAAAGGAVFEGLSPAVVRAWQAVMNRYGVKNGKLTEEAAAKARSLGLDPDSMDERLARTFADDASRAASESELGAKHRTGEFDIRTTEGQRTKRPDVLGQEEEMRRGLMGRDAQEVMSEFDQAQKADVERAVQEKIGRELAPEQAGSEPTTTGQRIADAMREQRAAADRVEDELWSYVGWMTPKKGGLDMLPAALFGTMKKRNAVPSRNLPQSSEMLDLLDDYRTGKPLRQPFKVLNESDEATVTPIDDMRRRLLGLYQGAERGSNDERVAKAVYDGFNQWVDDLAEKAMINGAPNAAAKLIAARGFTRDLRSLFEPKKGNSLSPGGKILKDVFENQSSPEGVVNSLFGRGGPTAAAPKGTVEAVTHMKRILKKSAPEAWDDIRLAYWTKVAQDSRGRVLTPGRLRNNIDAAFHNQPSVMKVLFTPEERLTMRRLSTALEDVTYKSPNPSGTSYELERMRKKYKGDNAAKTILQTLQKRATFSKHNFFMARVYQLLAKKMPVSVFSSKEGAGAALARRTTSQDINRRQSGSLASVGASGAAQADVQ